MPLIRAQKEELVNKLTEELQNSRVSLVFAYTGLKSQMHEDLRTRAFTHQGKIKMLSNNLLRLVLKNLGVELELPEKPLALAYGFSDEVTAAKTLIEFGRETDTLEVLGGWVDGQFFDTAKISTLAALPSREMLHSQLVGRLGGLIGSLTYSLNHPIQKFAYVVNVIESANPPSGIEEPAPANEQPNEESNETPEEIAEATENEGKSEEAEAQEADKEEVPGK